MPAALDLRNQRFGRLVALEPTELRDGSNIIWRCECDCGKIHLASVRNLRGGFVRSCGCLSRDIHAGLALNLRGQRFGRLLVLKSTNKRTTDGSVIWKCKCDCGSEVLVPAKSLVSEHTKSCGCLQKERAFEQRVLPEGKAAFNAVLRMYKRHAKERNLSWELTEEQALELFTSSCHYCGAPPSNHRKPVSANGGFRYNGIDRIDSNKPYILENVVSCCKYCNRAKGKMKYEDFLVLANRIATRHPRK